MTGLIGQYAHGNEPSHHIAYLYDYAGQPWKTQKYVRQIHGRILQADARRPDRQRRLRPDVGVVHHERVRVLSRSRPARGIYAIGTPLFPEIKYNLENGKTFTIRAKNVSPANKYILNAKLNGAPYKKAS